MMVSALAELYFWLWLQEEHKFSLAHAFARKNDKSSNPMTFILFT